MPTPLIPLSDGTEYHLPWKVRVELGELYLDVDEELQKMRLWCLANPRRLKTPRGILRFITGWMAKSGKKRANFTTPQSVVRASQPLSDADRQKGSDALAHIKQLLKR